MVRVSGPLVNVTTSASSVRDVQVHTKKVRAWGDGLMTPDPSQATLSNGEVEFEAAPGPVVMVLFMAEAGAETVSLVVGEGATQSLADAYRDGQMANDRDAGELAGILEQIRESVVASAEARAGAEAAAEDAAGSAASAGRDAGRAETAEAGAVEAEEGAEAGQELSEDAAAVAVAAAVGAAEASSDKADKTYVDAEKWTKGTLPDGADLNELDAPFGEQGAHGLSSANTYLNSPFQGRNGSVLVIANGFGQVTQLAWEYTSQAFYMRSISNFYSSPKTWNDWEQVALQGWVTQQIQAGPTDVEIKPKVVPEGTDLTDLSSAGRLAPGFWSVTSRAHADSLTGLPPGVGACSFQQWPYNPAAVASTRLLLGAGNTGVWYQSLGGMNVWQPWVRLDAPSEAPPKETPSTHGARREALRRAKGNVIGTAGKGVVALRFDHNIDDFNSLILPELVARDLPATQCHYVEELTAEPSTSSWAEIQNVAIRHGIEAWSHGRTHQDATGYDAIKHELIDAKDDLEAAMPLLEIPGLIVPGVTGTKFDGWSANLSSPAAFTDWEAGRLVAAKYASCDGHGGLLTSPGTSLGWQSYFVDSQTSSTATTGLINEAADTGAVAVIALHANRVNKTGGIPLEVYREILDHIVPLRDEGRIEVLTVAGATVADPGTTWRQDIGRPLSSWSLGAGWTRDADGLHGVGPSGTAALAVNSSRYNWGEGHVWEAWVDVEGGGSVDFRLTLNTQKIDLTRSLTGGGKMRLPFTIPKGEASVSMRLTAPSGQVTVTGAGIRAV